MCLGGKLIVLVLSWLCRFFHGVTTGVPLVEDMRLRLTDKGRARPVPGTGDPFLGTRDFRKQYQSEFLSWLVPGEVH